MQPSSAEPLPSPTEPFGTRRFFCGLPLTCCASQEPDQRSSVPLSGAIHSEPLPILRVARVPSCAVKPAILLGLVGLPARLLLYRLTTRSLRLLDLCFLRVLVPACARSEVPGARYLGFPLFPLRINNGRHCIGLQ